MAAEQPNPGDFISLLSSEDEAPRPKKKKRSLEDTGNSARSTAGNVSMNRSKRARVSSSSDSISGAKGSEEGEIDENGASVGGDEGQTSSGGGADKKPDGGTSSVFVPPNPPVYVKDSLSLQLPVFSQKREGSWFARFKDWTQVFFTGNAQHAAAFTPALVQAAYKQYIDNHSGLKATKKRSAKQASAQFEEAGSLANLLNTCLQPSGSSQQSTGAPVKPGSQPKESARPSQSRQVSTSGGKPDSSAGQLDRPIATLGGVYVVNDHPKQPKESTCTPHSDRPLNGAAMGPKEGIPTGADALEQQRRYFPSASDPANMCLLCGREGHIAADCAHSSCRFCGEDGHWDFACPTVKTRCSKCNQLGHTAAACVEKLALTKDEGLACSYCSSPDHLEAECTETWRSFHPDTETIKTVAFLPASCSTCGDEQHYSSDCRQRRVSNPTWSLANRRQYLDPECSSTPIEEAFGRTAKARPNHQPDLKIRGHASRATRIHYSETDDSDVEFLGQRPANNKPARIGQIRVSSNIQMPNARQQPPLPPGPPPAMSSQLSGRYPPPSGVQRPVMPSSLPAKPPAPAPTRNYNSVPPPPPAAQDSFNQSSRGRGGRGGGRGAYRGGRFRGRKRGG